MEKVLNYIKENKLILPNEIIGVGCSGGRDSISLLHYLHSIKDKLECEVVAININHCIRENSSADSAFVADFCKEHGIKLYSFRVDALKIAHEEKLGIEEAARKARYGTFESVIDRGLVDKIAIAHHLSDQTETILLNIFRGCGLSGVKGMEPIRDGKFIRPLLSTSRQEIESYIAYNCLSFVNDETNLDNGYTRNYLRNVVIPMIKKHFPALDRNISNFSKICIEDDKYINSMVDKNAIIRDKDVSRIPMSYFYMNNAITSRIIMKALAYYSLVDVERKHINIIRNFALEANNGARINLPFNLKVYKEYDFITIAPEGEVSVQENLVFHKGKTNISYFGLIRVVSSKVFNEIKPHQHVIDAKALPEGCIWRTPEPNDKILPFNNTSMKKLGDFFTEKKIPKRLRTSIPVLAKDDEVYIVADVEISDKLKVTENSTELLKINYTRNIY